MKMPNIKLEIVKVNSFLNDVKQKDATNICGQIKGKSQVPETYVQTHDHMLCTGNCKMKMNHIISLPLWGIFTVNQRKQDFLHCCPVFTSTPKKFL